MQLVYGLYRLRRGWLRFLPLLMTPTSHGFATWCVWRCNGLTVGCFGVCFFVFVSRAVPHPPEAVKGDST